MSITISNCGSRRCFLPSPLQSEAEGSDSLWPKDQIAWASASLLFQRDFPGCKCRNECLHYGLWRLKVVFTGHNTKYVLKRVGRVAYCSQPFTSSCERSQQSTDCDLAGMSTTTTGCGGQKWCLPSTMQSTAWSASARQPTTASASPLSPRLMLTR